MKRALKKQGKGFTIIEILIVLTIAGLILLIVFLAVPQLQRNTRDNQRQSMAGRLSTELGTYSSNNQGTYPFSGAPAGWPGTLCNTQAASGQNCGDWFSRYISGSVNIKDPKSGSDTSIYYTTATGTPTWAAGSAWISAGNKCNGEQVVAGSGAGANAKDFAILIALDRSNTYYCTGNT